VRNDLNIAQRLGNAVFAAGIGSAVFSLYFLFVGNVHEYIRIQVAVFVGALIVALAFQFLRTQSRPFTVILFLLGGGFGGIAYSMLFGVPFVQSAWIGVALGFLVSIAGLWAEFRNRRRGK